MPTALELREKRAKLIHDARELLSKAETEKRDPTDEERGRWDKMISDADNLGKDAERMERQLALEKELNEPLDRRSNPGQPGDGSETRGSSWEMELREMCPRAAKGEMLRFDAAEGEAERQLVHRAQPAYNKAFRQFMKRGIVHSSEERSLQADSDIAGGFTVPTQFAARLIIFVKNMLFVRQRATVIPITGSDAMGFPSLDTDVDDADWTSELATGNTDPSMAFGKRELRTHPLAKSILISNKLLRISAIDIESLVLDRLAYKFGVAEEKAFMTGSGSQQPLGVFVASNAGISTNRDVSTGNTTSSIQTDGLIEAKYSLKVQYWPEASWTFNRTAVKQIAKLKDGEGQYIWQPSIQQGQADRLLGFPIDMSEYAPNTFTTGKYVGLLGAWSRYWIGDSLQMTMQRLVELKALTNQVMFIARKETDAMPVLEEAFVRVKLA